MRKLDKTKMVIYRLDPAAPLTTEQLERLKKLDDLPDEEIDYSDIPPLTEDFWKNAKRGALYRPIKQAVSVRVDADVLAWLKKDGPGYQSRINAFLRERMLADLGATGKGLRAQEAGVPQVDAATNRSGAAK